MKTFPVKLIVKIRATKD